MIAGIAGSGVGSRWVSCAPAFVALAASAQHTPKPTLSRIALLRSQRRHRVRGRATTRGHQTRRDGNENHEQWNRHERRWIGGADLIEESRNHAPRDNRA